MSHPEGYNPRVPIRGLLRTVGTTGKLNSSIGPCTEYRVVVVSIPACHTGDPGLIPGNDALCRVSVMSHPHAYYQGSQSAGYSGRSEREGI